MSRPPLPPPPQSGLRPEERHRRCTCPRPDETFCEACQLPVRPRNPDWALHGDQGWWQAHFELGLLHSSKADSYGNDQDALANYVDTSEKWGDCDESTPARRIDEKMTRARNLILAGRADEVEEWMDIAALALGAEALRRRRL